jgi:hypothetical protein
MPVRRNTIASAAMVCAIVAFFISPLGGFLLGLLAILLGLVGFLRSVAPRMRGGLLSLAAILLGAIAAVVKVIAGALGLLF